ncbi:unnamed protein product [Pleuronectes platessa]|uniref:Uncharacterized protein n=1 Tax=Pleuronectes platessa TaxID=8262 RepID=A0A9N7Z2E1_PLEPL|nr:unnamed protein product [Pleuronectes platessa]
MTPAPRPTLDNAVGGGLVINRTGLWLDGTWPANALRHTSGVTFAGVYNIALVFATVMMSDTEVTRDYHHQPSEQFGGLECLNAPIRLTVGDLKPCEIEDRDTERREEIGEAET